MTVFRLPLKDVPPSLRSDVEMLVSRVLTLFQDARAPMTTAVSALINVLAHACRQSTDPEAVARVACEALLDAVREPKDSPS